VLPDVIIIQMDDCS